MWGRGLSRGRRRVNCAMFLHILFPRFVRRLCWAGALAAGLFADRLQAAGAPSTSFARDTGGVAVWGGSPSDPSSFTFAGSAYKGTNQFSNQTVRLIVHPTLNDQRVRIRLSNELGTAPVTIGSAHIAISDAAGVIVPGTDRVLTFNGGSPSATLPIGAPLVSDSATLDISASSNLAISLYLPGAVALTTAVTNTQQQNYVSPPDSGDLAGSVSLPLDPAQPSFTQWPLLTAVEVHNANAKAFVTLGSSIALGVLSTVDANARWTDYLARRLHHHGLAVSVVNASIPANALVGVFNGPNALARLERDVFSVSGVGYVFINDILGVESQVVGQQPQGIIDGLRQLVTRAHAHHIKVYAGTIIPLGGASGDTENFEANRAAVNAFIRSGARLDGYVDFDLAVRDPANPSVILAAYDGGDHHHPNDAGNAALSKAFDLALFQ